MKRTWLALAPALAVILSLTACGGERDPPQDGTSSTDTTSAPVSPQLQDGSGTVGIYARTASLLPETVTAALRDLSFDTMLFYWPDPDAETASALDFIPVTELEPDGTNRILLVSRWLDLQIQVHSGTPQINDAGRSWWLTDQILYEGELDVDEPMWLSLNFPEGAAELCLFFKLPGNEVWSTWQLTQQGLYRMEGYTAFIAS